MTDTATAVASPSPETDMELKHETYVLLKLEIRDGVRYWRELGEITGEAKYGYYPTAKELGLGWGEGEYMYYPTGGYQRLTLVTVVAETVYSEKREDEVPE